MCKCFGRAGKDREGMETGDAGWEDGGAAIAIVPRRERRQRAGSPEHHRHFNPRPREGSDGSRIATDIDFLISIHAPAKRATAAHPRGQCTQHISIHAPAKGATRTPRCHWRARLLFQSTLPRRERQAEQRKADKTKAFQSTLPRRERPRRCRSNTAYPYFNPRSREGSDMISGWGD